MLYLKLFETEQERQACEETQDYVSYTVETDKVHIHEKQSFCILTLNNDEVIEIEGSGELTSDMTSPYLETAISAEIGNLCTSIGDYAFNNCSGLTTLTISNSVTSIGDNAFTSCSELTNITIPNSVTSIGVNVFSNCNKLTSVTIGSGVTSIGNFAFNLCQGLTDVIIPNSVTSIGQSIFSSCGGLTSVTIGSGVTSIGDYAFNNCSGLINIISLATTAPTINSNTFRYVKNNGTLYVPSGSNGYDTWMGTGNYYLGKYSWTKVEQ